MFTRLTMRLDTNEIGPQKASVLQGVLFEHVDAEYASFLHTQNYHPYSQYIYKDDKFSYWVINTLNGEAYDRIIAQFLRPEFKTFHINKMDQDITVLEKSVVSLDPKDMLSEFYTDKSEYTTSLKFLTPTAFKQNGNYVILPDIRLIFRSLMHKYSEASDLEMIDEEALQQLEESAYVSGHRITSIRYPMEGIDVPGFVGEVSISIKGTETMRRYARMLFQFAEFSGIGIKTAMGMGAVKIMEKEKTHDRD